MANHVNSVQAGKEARSARVLRSANGASSDANCDRLASFRPPEEVAVRRDTLEAFRERLRQEAGMIQDHPATSRAMAFASLLADEALQRNERVAAQQGRFARDFGTDSDFWFLVRRVLTVLGEDTSEVIEALSHHATHESKMLCGLEAIELSWRQNGDAQELLGRLEDVMQTTSIEDLGVFTALFATMLAVDLMLELGRTNDALDALDALRHHPGLDAQQRGAVAALEATWASALGLEARAVTILEAATTHALVDEDFEDLLLSLVHDSQDRDHAFQVLTRSRLARRHSGHALELAGHTVQRDPIVALDVMGRATRDFPEDEIVREVHVALMHAESPQSADLIDLLNARLEQELTAEERVWTLCELGQLYETRSQDGEDLVGAAAEVYVEALSIVPNHAPALRALGRLYSRLNEWELLCALYESEISSLGNAPYVWRRHFQVAELYESKLSNFPKALSHYLQVVRKRAGYLPALKGAARLLEREGRWHDLADMFLASVATTQSRRQKLYLLDKVAEIAEQRLGNVEVAIGAWEEILHLDGEHPRAFAALGRLYARSGRWMDLFMVNERELSLVEDSEEAAALLVRNAEIAAEKLQQFDLAEDAYRRALALHSDYLPALEGLGRIYVRGARWDELVAMTEKQLVGAPLDSRETLRHLGALAELMEFESGHEADAVLLYNRMLELDPHASHVTQALLRLHRQTGNWRALLELLETQLTVLPWEQHGRVYAEMAFVLEWRLESAAEAFHIFLKAAEFQPAELHWLHGIVRTWRAAHIDAFQLSKVLEDLALRPMAAEARDAYFLAISRLRERFEKRPEKSVGYRVHGDESNRENQAVLRLANALTKDRSGLERRRAESPWFDFEQVVDHREWTSRRRQALQRVMDQANDDERTWLTSWLPNGMAQAWIEADDGGSQVLRYELERIVSGNGQRLDCRTHEMLLLRAEELKTAGDIQGWMQTVADEIALSPSRELRVLRLIDLARCVPASQWLEKAVNEAFGEDPCMDDGAVANHMFDALREAQAYELLRFALEKHVLSVQLSDGRRAEIFGELGQLLEEKLLDLEASRRAYEHCWQLTGEREQLASIVRVCKSLGHIESATEFQTRHFEATLNGDFSLEERLKSGMELSELNVQIGDTARAIKHLEMLLHPESSSPMYREAKLRLAHLQCDDGDVQRGISLFEGTLTIKACAADIEHWRRLVRAYRSDVGDLAASYSLQWKLVRARPESLDDVDELLEIAWEINELSDCCKQLEEFGRTLDLDAQVTLIGRAAVALDEDLGRSEDAARLYRELVAIGGPSSTLDFRRRLAFSLARSVGRESEALKHFELLCREEPFEGTNYQGMVDLYERTQCFDRARVARQFMRTLNMKVEGEEIRAKSTPSRPFADNDIRHLLLPKQLQKVFPAIHAVMPVAEKIWSGDLPQKKAVDGHKVKEGKFTDMLAQACQLFGLKRVRAFATDAGPLAPFVFQEASPALWFNSDLLSEATDGELKFLAGYAAAMAWSEASGLVALDGRNVWHLMEGIAYRQTGAGFTDRIDAESQRLADEVGSPFYAVARRRVAQALDGLGPELADAHCEAWPLLLQRFACRVGLIACSDVEDATRAMLRMDGWVESLNDEATQRRMRRSSEVEELFRFAASEEFLEARHRVGLGSRPSQFARE